MNLSFFALDMDHTQTTVLVFTAKLHPIGSQWRQSTDSRSVYSIPTHKVRRAAAFLKPSLDAG